jgi:hypothetical protein
MQAKQDLEFLIDNAEKGDAGSQFILGCFYDKIHVQENENYNPIKAKEWYEKAIEQGHVGSQYQLAELFADNPQNRDLGNPLQICQWFDRVSENTVGDRWNPKGEHLKALKLCKKKYIKGQSESELEEILGGMEHINLKNIKFLDVMCHINLKDLGVWQVKSRLKFFFDPIPLKNSCVKKDPLSNVILTLPNGAEMIIRAKEKQVEQRKDLFNVFDILSAWRLPACITLKIAGYLPKAGLPINFFNNTVESTLNKAAQLKGTVPQKEDKITDVKMCTDKNTDLVQNNYNKDKRTWPAESSELTKKGYLNKLSEERKEFFQMSPLERIINEQKAGAVNGKGK